MQVENVMEDIDFRIEVTRDQLLSMTADYFTRVTDPVDMALKTAAMTMQEISEVLMTILFFINFYNF